MSFAKPILCTLALALLLPACSDDSSTPPKADGPFDHDALVADLSAGFACGATLSCKSGEYCESSSPGACGGDPVPDAGTCPANCVPTNCGSGSEQVCLCTGFSCKALPSGCTSCSCYTPMAGCTCSETGGGPHVSCAMP